MEIYFSLMFLIMEVNTLGELFGFGFGLEELEMLRRSLVDLRSDVEESPAMSAPFLANPLVF